MLQKLTNADDHNQTHLVQTWMLHEAMLLIEELIYTINLGLPTESQTKLHNVCSEQLVKWWQEHQEKENMQIRANAALKLNERERKALGIDSLGQNIRTRIVK